MLQKKCAYEYIDLDLASTCTKSFALVDYYALSEWLKPMFLTQTESTYIVSKNLLICV